MNSISLFDPDFINKADADKLYAALVKLPWSEQSYFTPRGQFTLPRVFQ